MYEYALYTPKEQTDLEFSHLGENHLAWNSCGVSEELEIGGLASRCENTIGTTETCWGVVYLLFLWSDMWNKLITLLQPQNVCV